MQALQTPEPVQQRTPPEATPHKTTQSPDLATTQQVLTESEALALMSACGELGVDPSSNYFTTRTKNIAYTLCIQGKWFQLQADYFIQPQQYNDFSGGYKRYYQMMPKQFLECYATQKVLNTFKQAYQIPDCEPILVQVQTSHITSENEGTCLTGQGIHSDGADKAILVCLERNNIQGAENAIYTDINGERAAIAPFTLNPGQAILWHDNQVFHHVQPARVLPPATEGSRTILIAHYPATYYLTGNANPGNSLETILVDERKRLRNKPH